MITTGGYRDFGEAIASAVENWLVIHRQLQQNAGTVVLDGGTTVAHERTAQAKKRPHPVRGVPELFLSVSHAAADAPHPQQQTRSDEDEFSPDQWVFGQFNKLLPLKANCRALAHLLDRNPSGVALNEAGMLVAAAAAELGAYLQERDVATNSPRSDALATAFPNHEDRQGKGKLRYANQFVGATTKQRLTGLMADMQMLVLRDEHERPPYVLLTQAAWEFAQLSNPVLDDSNASTKFTEEERTYLIEHVSRYVPNEASAWRQLLRLVAGGQDTPDALDAALACSAITKAHLSTQRSGAISRMIDLGLLRRYKTGLFVTYHVTNGGVAWANAK